MAASNIKRMRDIRNDKNEIKHIQNALRALNLQSCKIIANWLAQHINMLENYDAFPHKSIEELNLSKRTMKVLKRNNINTIKSLIQKASNWDDIRIMRGAGEKVLNELATKIEDIQKRDFSDDGVLFDTFTRTTKSY